MERLIKEVKNHQWLLTQSFKNEAGGYTNQQWLHLYRYTYVDSEDNRESTYVITFGSDSTIFESESLPTAKEEFRRIASFFETIGWEIHTKVGVA